MNPIMQNPMTPQMPTNNFMGNRYSQPQPTINTGIIWVQGIEGAKAYQIPASSAVILMDSENEGRLYIKTSDNVGMCNLRLFDYSEVTTQPTTLDTSNYVTRAEFDALVNKLTEGAKKDAE